MTQTYFVRTFGCQMNEHDSERIAGVLEETGMAPADEMHNADVIVLNTCCIRENADTRLYGTLGHLKALKDQKPELQIAVGGCLAQKDQSVIQQRAPWVDVVFGTYNVGRIAQLLATAKHDGALTEILEEATAFPSFPFAAHEHATSPTPPASSLPARRERQYAAWIALQIGCDNNCAFCIVPSVRGREISRPFGDIVAEATQLAAAGVREITLLGQNVNSFGRDLTMQARTSETINDSAEFLVGSRWLGDEKHRVRSLFADLLRELGAIEGIERIRYTSPHPKDFRDDVIAAMADTPAVCEHLHLPLQSGSNRVLAAMHRGYTAEKYWEKLTAARQGIEDLAVTTDIIVGFPGETQAEFDESCALAEAAQFDSAYVFQYSPREGTEAARMTDQFVDADELGRRFDVMQAIVEESALRTQQARIGRVEEVLVEGPSRRDRNIMNGRTRQNRLVHFGGNVAPGSLAMVEITSAAPHFLRAELREVTSPPRHQRRIPVVLSQ